MARYSDDDINNVYDLCHDGNTGRCFYCDIAISFQNYGDVGARGAWEVDHYIPLSRGGAHHPKNWVPACVDCNTRKAAAMPAH